jgi:hypothetical protein
LLLHGGAANVTAITLDQEPERGPSDLTRRGVASGRDLLADISHERLGQGDVESVLGWHKKAQVPLACSGVTLCFRDHRTDEWLPEIQNRAGRRWR